LGSRSRPSETERSEGNEGIEAGLFGVTLNEARFGGAPAGGRYKSPLCGLSDRRGGPRRLGPNAPRACTDPLASRNPEACGWDAEGAVREISECMEACLSSVAPRDYAAKVAGSGWVKFSGRADDTVWDGKHLSRWPTGPLVDSSACQT
jgi:hypothetical protein